MPNDTGLRFNFQRRKTIRDGADHLLTVAYDTLASTCPVQAVEQSAAVEEISLESIKKGTCSPVPRAESEMVSRVIFPDDRAMTKVHKGHAEEAGIAGDFPLHSFRSGGRYHWLWQGRICGVFGRGCFGKTEHSLEKNEADVNCNSGHGRWLYGKRRVEVTA